MSKKLALTVVAFLAVAACVFGASMMVSSDVRLPEAITATTPCPATGCVDEACHGFDNVPEPDGMHSMKCPEATCSSAECHAWDSLRGRYHQASDASMNMWIVLPVVLVVGLVLIVRKVK